MYYDPKTYRRKNNYRNKYHDYKANASYFITMCVKNKEKCLSKIENCGKTNEAKVVLSKYGKIIEQQFNWLCEQYEYIKIPAYVIMPDHIHFVIEVFDFLKKENTPKVKPLAELVGALKMTCSKYIHKAGKPNFTWQRNYFDIIIRSEMMQNNVQQYIDRNPLNWINRYKINGVNSIQIQSSP